MFSFLSSLLDGENADDDGNDGDDDGSGTRLDSAVAALTQPTSSRAPASESAAFADGALGVHECLSRWDIASAARLISSLAVLVDASSETSDVGARKEMLADLRSRVGAVASMRLAVLAREIAGGAATADAARLMWLAAADAAPEDFRSTDAFAGIVTSQFRSFADDALRGASGGGSENTCAATAPRPHPLVWRHFNTLTNVLPLAASQRFHAAESDVRAAAAIAAASAEAAAAALAAAARSEDSEEAAASSDARGTGGLKEQWRAAAATPGKIKAAAERAVAVGAAVGAACALPPAPVAGAIKALTAVLSEASVWESNFLRSQDAPPHLCARIAISVREAAQVAAVSGLANVRDAAALDATLRIATALADHAEGRTTRSAYARTVEGVDAVTAAIDFWRESALDAVNTAWGGGEMGERVRVRGEGGGGGAILGGGSHGDERDSRATVSSTDETNCAGVGGGGGGMGDDIDNLNEGGLAALHAGSMGRDNGNRADDGRDDSDDGVVTLAVTFGTRSRVGGAGVGPPVSQPPPLPPLSITLEAAVALCNEAADQTSYVCALFSRYDAVSLDALLRVDANAGVIGNVGTAGGGGGGGSPAALPPAAALQRSVYALQSDFVSLERAFLLNALAEATRDPPSLSTFPFLDGASTGVRGKSTTGDGWRPVSVDADTSLRIFCVGDSIFFICSKSLARAVGSLSPLSAAAVINFVAAGLDGAGAAALRVCVALAAQRKIGLSRSAGGAGGDGVDDDEKGGVGAGADEIDAEIVARLSAALRGGVGGNEGEGAGRAGGRRVGVDDGGGSGGGGDGDSLGVLGEGDGDDGTPDGATHASSLTPTALTALNTLATAATYAASLLDRVVSEVASIFSDGASSPALELAVETLAASCAACASPLDTGAADAAAALAGPGLEAMRRALRPGGPLASYEIRREVYESMVSSSSVAVGGGSGGRDPLLCAFWVGVVARGGLDAALRALVPRARGALLCALARRIVAILEPAWWHVSRVDAYGALLMSAQLRELTAAVVSRAPPGAATAAVRAEFARVAQAVAVLGLEKATDVYSLTFPVAQLSRADVEHLLSRRAGKILDGGADVAAVDWARVSVKD